MQILETLPWLLVPLTGLGLVVALHWRNGGPVPMSYVLVTGLAMFAALMIAPTCMCTDPMSQLAGALIGAVCANVVLFLVTWIATRTCGERT
jgi:hypothetical protein